MGVVEEVLVPVFFLSVLTGLLLRKLWKLYKLQALNDGSKEA